MLYYFFLFNSEIMWSWYNDFTCYFIFNHKNPQQFQNEYNNKANKFYFHLVKHLLDLPDFKKEDEHRFYLSRRNKTTNEHFDDVLKEALYKEMSEEQLSYKAQIVKYEEYPELWVTDYMLWAVQRFLVKGEGRYLKALKDKLVSICEKENHGNGILKKYSIEEFLKRNSSKQQ